MNEKRVNKLHEKNNRLYGCKPVLLLFSFGEFQKQLA